MNGKDLMEGFSHINERYLEDMLSRRQERQEEIRERRRRKVDFIIKAGIWAAAAAFIWIMASGRGESWFSRIQARDAGIPAGSESAEELSAYDDLFSGYESSGDLSGGESVNGSEKEYCIVIVKGEGIEITDTRGNVLFADEDRFARAKVIYAPKLTVNPVYQWQQLADYGAGSGSHQVLDDRMLWKITDPLAVIIPDENFKDQNISGGISFFDIENGTWLMEPEQVSAFSLIGNGLWTDSQVPANPGGLRKPDGSVIELHKGAAADGSEYEGAVYRQYQNYIVSGEYPYDNGSGTVWDFEGNKLTAVNDIVMDVLDNGYVIRKPGENDRTVVYDSDGNEIFSENSGLIYRGQSGGYFNWIAGGRYGAAVQGVESLVTDDRLQIVLTESEFFAKNPQYAEGLDEIVNDGFTVRDSCNISVCGVNDAYIEVMLERMGSHEFIFCDRDFVELYPKKIIKLKEEYHEISYTKDGLQIVLSDNPDTAGRNSSGDSSGPAAADPSAHDCSGIARIPVREASPEEEEEYKKLEEKSPDSLDSFRLDNVTYRFSDIYFYSKENGLCVFPEGNGRERIYEILDLTSAYWDTKIKR